jgi:hypothetical protein
MHSGKCLLYLTDSVRYLLLSSSTCICTLEATLAKVIVQGSIYIALSVLYKLVTFVSWEALKFREMVKTVMYCFLYRLDYFKIIIYIYIYIHIYTEIFAYNKSHLTSWIYQKKELTQIYNNNVNSALNSTNYIIGSESFNFPQRIKKLKI